MNTLSKVGLGKAVIDRFCAMLVVCCRRQRKYWIHIITSERQNKGKFELLRVT